MEAKLRQSLVQLGCSDKECRFFLACFKLGPSSITDIAAKARLQRSTAYLLAEQLIEKGLLAQDYRTYNKLYTAAAPETVIRLLEAKKRRLGRLSADMQKNITALESLYKTPESLPVVTTHHGPSGLVSIWKDILNASGEILLWTNQATERRLFASSQHQQFIAERLQRKLPIRVLAVDNDEGRALLPDDQDLMRQTRLLPPKTTFSSETYLYNDKVAILDYQTNVFGVIIVNRLIHEFHVSSFEMAWKSLTRKNAA